MDVTNLDLKKKYELIFLPFHSITEILSADLQYKALKSITTHLKEGGTFILTLQNPGTRLKLADGVTRIIGEFPIDQGRRMIISYTNQYNKSEKIVSGFQFYEIYDSSDTMIEKRFLKINFKPIFDSELKEMIKDLELEIVETYGDYSYNEFNEETSDFIIYKMLKNSKIG